MDVPSWRKPGGDGGGDAEGSVLTFLKGGCS